MTAKLEIVMVDGTQGAGAPSSAPGSSQPPGAPVAPPVHQQPNPRREKQDPPQQAAPKKTDQSGLGPVFDAAGKAIGKAIPEVEAIRSVLDVVKNLRRILEDAGKLPNQPQGRPQASVPTNTTQTPTGRPSVQQPQPQATPRPPQVQDVPLSRPAPSQVERESLGQPITSVPRPTRVPAPQSTSTIPKPSRVPTPQPTSIPNRTPPVVAPPVQAGAGRAVAGTAARGVAGAGAAGSGVGVAAVANPVGITVAAAVVAIGGLAIATKMLSEKFKTLASEVEDFSPALLSVSAGREARMIELQQERANKLGGGLAGLESARGRLEEASYRVQTEIYELLLRNFAPFFEAVIDSVTAGVNGINALIKLVELIHAVLSTPLDTADDDAAMKELKTAMAEFSRSVADIFKNNSTQQTGSDPDIDAVLSIRTFGNQFINVPPISNPFGNP